ncbi:MAG: glutaredoxin family protein [Candidatus Nanopelagicales bacterium]
MSRVTLIGKPGCHLCDDARAIIISVCADTETTWEEVSIEDDPALFDEHWDRIPVVLVDGRPHDFWRVDADRLRSALATSPPS